MIGFLIPTRPGLNPPPPLSNLERRSRWATMYFGLPLEQRYADVGVVSEPRTVDPTEKEVTNNAM